MRNGRELTVVVNTRLTLEQAGEWEELARRSGVGPSLFLRQLIQRELTDWKFLPTDARTRPAADAVLELFAETMAMSLEGDELARFMEIAQRVAPGSEFVKRTKGGGNGKA